MNKTVKIVLAAIAVSLLAAPVLCAQSVKIDYKMNMFSNDSTNALVWSLGSKKTADKLDAASGASLAKSTSGLDAVRYDAPDTKKATIPGGFRSLLLYPIGPLETVTADNLTVTAEGKTVTVRYVHRGTAYELVTDKNGKFDVLTGAKRAPGLADNVDGRFILKAEFLKEGGDPMKMSSLDWAKIKLVPDVKAADASRWYEGTAEFEFEKGILTIKGTLSEKKAK